jgi:hypothetical protein
VNLKFCKFVLGISKKSVNIAARAEIYQYPLDVYIKLQVLKYMARISNKDNNPLLLDAYSLSKTLHLNGTYSWYTFAENIQFFGNERRSVPLLQLHLGDIAYKFVVLFILLYLPLSISKT